MKQSAKGWLFISPALIHLILFALLPIAWALYLSFYDWNILKGDWSFVGFGNYAEMAQDTAFLNALKNSLVYAATSVPIGMAVALLVAILVAQKLRGLAIFRTIYYLPAISSQVAIAMVWIYMYLPESGLINAALDMAGMPSSTDFLNEVGWAMAALVFMSVWVGLGPRMILYLAGILNIPPALYEASALDGATGWTQFWRITLPMLAPTTLFVLITSTIGAMQLFTPIYMMTKGGPLDSTDMVGYHIFIEAWQNFDMGSASAQSFLLLAVILIVSILQFRLMKRQMEGYTAG